MQELQVSILCQSRLFLLPVSYGYGAKGLDSIHPLSIEAISPARGSNALGICLSLYPSSVNRGYFSCLGWRLFEPAVPLVSILCQSRLFLLRWFSPHNVGRGSTYPSSVNRGYFSCFQQFCSCSFFSSRIHPLSIEAISPATRQPMEVKDD